MSMVSSDLSVVIFLACATLLGAQTKASPATLTFSYQEGDAKLPVSQTLAKSTPVILTVNGIASPPGTTIGIK